MDYLDKARLRFESKFIPIPFAGCWLWEGSCNADEFGITQCAVSKIKRGVCWKHLQRPTIQ